MLAYFLIVATLAFVGWVVVPLLISDNDEDWN